MSTTDDTPQMSAQMRRYHERIAEREATAHPVLLALETNIAVRAYIGEHFTAGDLIYGYQIAQGSEHPRVTLPYVPKALRQFAEKGWLELQGPDHGAPGARTYYRITEAGNTEFTAQALALKYRMQQYDSTTTRE